MWEIDCMFATPKLEERFRKLVSVSEEIGGHLFYWWDGEHFNGKAWRTWRQIQGRTTILIHSWLIVPNRSSTPSRQYHPSSWQESFDIARATGEGNGWYRSVEFHTHPNGSTLPSNADIAHMATVVDQRAWESEAVIAAPSPLRVHFYYMRLPRRKVEDLSITRGEFLSWRENRFWPMRQFAETQ